MCERKRGVGVEGRPGSAASPRGVSGCADPPASPAAVGLRVLILEFRADLRG